ncbi:MAG: hypothetical protein LUE98_02535 [Tannerellaceae bacterium]|nr:hypothetical protein [Tannerellaceae bacterium]MCD8044782.1 hypothetical protein [Tannerellaceae bacterium]MCD8176349.1 hypothetical protein [Tannerellaceae bacterium]
MALFSFYNTRKPRQFDHKPIYYDPRKEALDEKISKAKKEMGLEQSEEEYKPNIKGTFVEGTSHLRKSRMKGHDSRTRTYTNVKLLVFVVLLLVIFWYIFIK